jgi:hypothetical protein
MTPNHLNANHTLITLRKIRKLKALLLKLTPLHLNLFPSKQNQSAYQALQLYLIQTQANKHPDS